MTTLLTRPSDETPAGSWQLDPERSRVEFRVKKFWGVHTVKGHFEDYDGHLNLSADPAIELTIDAASVHTANPMRDKHLRSADFFDVENHPRVRFVSESVLPHNGVLRVKGHLFARGESIPLELEAHVRDVEGELEIEADVVALHSALGLTWSPLRMIRPRSRLSVVGRLVPTD